MTLHLKKLAVGADTPEQVRAYQRRRLREAEARGAPPVLRHLTRHAPKRAEELLDGGSLYWIVRGVIRLRQRLTGIEMVGEGEERRCALILDPDLVATAPRAHRPFQGWRYLSAQDAPPDAPANDVGSGELPPAMAEELRELGLL